MQGAITDIIKNKCLTGLNLAEVVRSALEEEGRIIPAETSERKEYFIVVIQRRPYLVLGNPFIYTPSCKSLPIFRVEKIDEAKDSLTLTRIRSRRAVFREICSKTRSYTQEEVSI